MERIVPWGEWIKLLRPHYYKGARGNKPCDLERMLRIYPVQNLYDLSDMATVAEVIDRRVFSKFCGVESGNQVPDGDVLGRFRNLLLRSGLQEKLFAQVVYLLQERILLKKGTIVDSALIEAPSSTKNREKKRDPEAPREKGNRWHFGYKAHIDVNKDSGLVHTEKVTSDVTMVPELLTGDAESYMATADIWVLKNGKTPFFSIARRKGAIIKSTDDPRRVNMQTIAPVHKSIAVNGRNPPYGPR